MDFFELRPPPCAYRLPPPPPPPPLLPPLPILATLARVHMSGHVCALIPGVDTRTPLTLKPGP